MSKIEYFQNSAIKKREREREGQKQSIFYLLKCDMKWAETIEEVEDRSFVI